MIGLIHKTLFGLVEAAAGPEAVREVRIRAGVPADQYFAMNQAYDDGEWQRLLAAACEKLGVTPEQAEEAFAEFFLRDALTRWPAWFAMSPTARALLERQPRIHNSFATGITDQAIRDSILDKFRVESRPAELVVTYASPNRLCGLYSALARAVIRHYGEQATVEETRCCKRGDPCCEFHIRWRESESP